MGNAGRTGRVVAIALALLSTGATIARSADLGIGYIDSARIFIEFQEAKDAQARFDRLVTGWRDEALEKEKAVQQLRQEVRDQAPILSALRRQEKEAALQRAVSDYDAFIQDVWGPNGKAAGENERATGEIVQRIRVAVEKVAGEKGLQVVFDAAGGYLVYAAKNLDLTSEVLAELAASSTSTTP